MHGAMQMVKCIGLSFSWFFPSNHHNHSDDCMCKYTCTHMMHAKLCISGYNPHTHTPSNVSYRPFSWAHHAVCVCVCSLWTGKGSQHNIWSSHGLHMHWYSHTFSERNSRSTSLHSTWWIRISTVHWVCTHLWHTLSKKCFVHCFQFFRNCVNRCTHVVWHRSCTQCVYMMTQQCACELFPGRSYHLARNISCN